MLDLLPETDPTRTEAETAALMDRLHGFAREIESLGLPWAAAHIRKVADQVTAERNLAMAFRA
jgi:hypothetical protein